MRERYVVDQKTSITQMLQEALDEQRTHNMANILQKAIFEPAAQGSSSWWRPWLAVGFLASSHPSCGISVGEVTSSGDVERCCELP